MSGDAPSPLFQFARRYTVAAAGAAYAFTVGVANARSRALIRQIALHFGSTDGPHPCLPTIAVDDVTSPMTPVLLPEPVPADGNVAVIELLAIARLVRERAPKRILEIGTFDGRTTLALAANAPDDAIVHTLDLPPHASTRLALEPAERAFVRSTPGTRFHGTAVAHKIRQLSGDSAAFDFSRYVSDLVFVDGSHAYEYVLNDSIRALETLDGGRGVIVWHDYGEWPGVTAALDHLAATDGRFRDLKWIESTSLAVLDRRPA